MGREYCVQVGADRIPTDENTLQYAVIVCGALFWELSAGFFIRYGSFAVAPTICMRVGGLR